MSDEPINVEVKDSVAPGIRTKLLNIANAALEGATAVERLNIQLAKINPNALNKLTVSQNRLQEQTRRATSEFLAQEAALNKAIAAEIRAEIASSKLARANAAAAISADKARVSSERLAQAEARTATEQARTAVAAERLAAAQSLTIAAQSKAAQSAANLEAAQNRALISATKLAQQQQNIAASVDRSRLAAEKLAAAQTRTAIEQNNAAIAAEKLATAQSATSAQQTKAAVATAKLSQAQTNAQISATRLTVQQNKLATSSNLASVSAQRLASAQAKTAADQTRAAIAAQRLAAAQASTVVQQNKSAASAAKLAAAQANLASQAVKAAAQNRISQQQLQSSIARGVAIAARAAAASQNLAAAQLKAAAAATNAAAATTRLQAVQAGLNAAQARAAAAAANAAAATQRLATATAQAAAAQARANAAATGASAAQQRLATAAANAAAAQSRAALAALRLQQAQKGAAAGASAHAESLGGLIARLAALTGGAFSIKALIDLGDAYTTLQNKLQNVATSQGQVNELTTRLFQLANQTLSPVQESATAFTRFDRALNSLGKSQEESLRLTETVNKALVIGGATATESASALLQLSQAFNAGKLQGDEFRSLAENMPIVLDAIAKATNTPINQVKKLATEGKITSKVLFDAFKLIEGQVDATFSKTVPTVAQALVVVKNNVLQTFGEFDKANGITRTLSGALLTLANNIAPVTIAVTAIGAALAIAFAPAVVGLIGTAVTAIAGVLSPLAIVAGLAVAAGLAVYQFGDQMRFAEDKSYSLKNVAVATWQIIAETATESFDKITSLFGGSSASVGKFFSDLNDWGNEAFDMLMSYAKKGINFVIGLFAGANAAIGQILSSLPALFELTWKSIANGTASIVENIVNIWQLGLRKISDLLANVAPDIAGNINRSLDAVVLKLPRFDLSQQAKDAAGDVTKAFSDAFSKDFLGDAANAVTSRAKQLAQQAARAADKASYGGAQLRAAGPNTNVAEIDNKSAKAAERRVLMLQRMNAELDKQINSFGKLAEVRAVQEKLDEYDIQLASRKYPILTAGERETLKVKLEQIEVNKRVQASQDAIYESFTAPARKYKDDLSAINNLLRLNAISEEQAAEATRKSSYERERATNPLADYERDLRQQNALLSLNTRERNAQAQVFQIQNSLEAEGKQLSSEKVAQITAENIALQKRTELTAAYDQIISVNNGAREALSTEQAALNMAYERGAISLQNYSAQMTQLTIAKARLNVELGNGTFEEAGLAAVGRLLEGYRNALSGISAAFGDFFQQIGDGFADSVGHAIAFGGSLKDALINVAQNALSQLLSSLIKVGLQFLINQALGTESAAVTAAATTASTAAQIAGIAAVSVAAGFAMGEITAVGIVAASLLASAWAPAAAAVSLATLGQNAIGAAAGIISTYALTAGLAVIPGFKSGGYTGDVGVNTIAGVTHGKEFVMNSAATAANRGVLERMNRGESIMGGSSISVEIHNYGSGKEFEVQQIDEHRIRIIARDEAKSVVASEADGITAANISRPGSRTSKAISRNTNAQRALT